MWRGYLCERWIICVEGIVGFAAFREDWPWDRWAVGWIVGAVGAVNPFSLFERGSPGSDSKGLFGTLGNTVHPGRTESHWARARAYTRIGTPRMVACARVVWAARMHVVGSWVGHAMNIDRLGGYGAGGDCLHVSIGGQDGTRPQVGRCIISPDIRMRSGHASPRAAASDSPETSVWTLCHAAA